MLPKSYKPVKTIQKMHRTSIHVKKSKFISTICPVSTVAEAEAFVASIKDEFSDATHNVFCYIVNADIPVERFSDDGEPAGTAGKPILQLIQSEGLTNVALVVTRYFGGILLGTGGLIRAYSDAGKEVIREAGIATFYPFVKIKLDLYYDRQREARYIIEKSGGIILDISYDEKVHLDVLIPYEKRMTFLETLSQKMIHGKDTGVIEYR